MSQDDLKERARQDEELYQKFANQLEGEHKGEFVAIARDGRVIVEADRIKVLEKALREFGSGNFAFQRVGYRALGRWRSWLGR